MLIRCCLFLVSLCFLLFIFFWGHLTNLSCHFIRFMPSLMLTLNILPAFTSTFHDTSKLLNFSIEPRVQMSSTTFSSVWGFPRCRDCVWYQAFGKVNMFQIKIFKFSLFAGHSVESYTLIDQSFWSSMNKENYLLSLTNVFWIVCEITKRNSLQHLYEGIYGLNKGLKVTFVYCSLLGLDRFVFSSEWNPEDRERKTSLTSRWMMPGPTADGPYLKKQVDDWLPMSKRPRAVGHKRPADRQQTDTKEGMKRGNKKDANGRWGSDWILTDWTDKSSICPGQGIPMRNDSISCRQHTLLFQRKVALAHKYLQTKRRLEKRFVRQCFISALENSEVESHFCHRWFTRRCLVIFHTSPTTNVPINQCLTYRRLMFVSPVFSSPPPPSRSCLRLLWPIFQKPGDHQTFILSQIWTPQREERRRDNRIGEAAKEIKKC